MSDAAAEARAVLWEWVGDADDPDPEQRAWKRAYVGAMLDACAALDVLGDGELDGFRALLHGAAAPVPAGADPAAATAHVDALRGALPVLTREPGPETLRPGWRHAGALGALAAAGVLAEDQVRELHARELAASAPWLSAGEVEELTDRGELFALAVPPASPEEEAEDAEAAATGERLGLRGPIERVLAVEDPAREDGLVVLAAVLRAEVVEVRFHHVAPVEGRLDPLRGFDELVESLDAPALRDERGTVYTPITPRPAEAQGHSARGGGTVVSVTAGSWRYLPAAPAGAGRLVATRGARSWTLR